MIGVLLAVALPSLLTAAGWPLGRAPRDRSFAQETLGSVVQISGEVPALTVEFDAGEATRSVAQRGDQPVALLIQPNLLELCLAATAGVAGSIAGSRMRG